MLTEAAWPAHHLGAALAAVARHCRLASEAAEAAAPPADLLAKNDRQLAVWIEAAATGLGLEAEPVDAAYSEVAELLGGVGPALVQLSGAEPRFLVILNGRGSQLVLLTPTLAQMTMDRSLVCAALCEPAEAAHRDDVERLIAEAGIPARRRPRARQVLLDQLLCTTRIGGCWVIRSAGGASLATQAREAGLPRLLLELLGGHLAEYSLWLLSWWLLGWMTLTGRLAGGWLAAWLVLLLALIPCRLVTTASGGLLALSAGALVKRRLLFGALRLEPDEIRHLGIGHLLGRVLESEAIELLALTGGFLGLTASIELLLAAWVLGWGAGSVGHVLLLGGVVLGALLLTLGYYRRRQRWTQARLDMTNDLVERMIGHRTRLAQEARARWNDGEDQALEGYLHSSGAMDRIVVWLLVRVPRLWFLAGLIGLAPAFVRGDRSTTALAVGVGGLVLAYRALRNLVEGLERLAGAAIAWERVKLFWEAATRSEPVGQPSLATVTRSRELEPANRTPLLDGHDLVYRYPGRAEPVLQATGLQITAGDRLLLEGPSGGGKSTLAALLAGLRVPNSGLLLLGGLDRRTVGAAGWRRRVVLAPQFQENYVFLETFAFNVLMGRGWPPSQSDLEEAWHVCRALGLGPLLDRMPAGLSQIVGETGWQLSHGEKSRLYIARALLQGADLIILDESFAALDPETLGHCLGQVLERAPTVLVIAHP
jgi:ATP-binding cassette subfamily B protein